MLLPVLLTSVLAQKHFFNFDSYDSEVLTVDIKPVRRRREADLFSRPIDLDEIESFDEAIERLTFVASNASVSNANQHRYMVKSLIDIDDLEIQGQVHFGSNKQSFNLIFDTGSYWTWVVSRIC